MRIRTIPLRTGLMLTILLMGLFTIGAVVVSEIIYRDHAIDSQRDALSVLVKLRAGDLLTKLEQNAGRLGLEIQHDPAFRTALKNRDRVVIETLLSNRFHQYFVTADVLKLLKIEAWDAAFQPIAAAINGYEAAVTDPACDNPADAAAARSGTQRLKPLVILCTVNHEPLMSVIVPVGLRPEGYINVIVDPRHDLARLEQELGMPLRLTQTDGAISYLSSNWQDRAVEDHALVVDYPLATATGYPILTVSLLVDMQTFFTSLKDTRNNIMMITGIATILTVMLAYLLTELIIVQPIRQLCARLQHPDLFDDNADDFDSNMISEFAELKELYEVLGKLPITDSLTGLANRAQLENRLKKLTDPEADPQQQHALCYLDLDRFKTLVDTCGHKAGELLLRRIAKLLREIVRDQDLVARIDGDEFAILLEQCPPEEVHLIVTNIESAINNYQFTWQDQHFSVAASIGVVDFNRDTDIKNPLSTAHTACYLATENIGNHTYYYRTGEGTSAG